jgi:putative ABC transport system permease protein
MNILQHLQIALRGLASNKLRTSLTMLGIIIGVGVVILVVAIGQGATQSVTNAINSLGQNILSVRPGQSRLRITAAVTGTTTELITGTAGSANGTTSTAAGTGVYTPGSTTSSTSLTSPNHLTLNEANQIGIDFPQSISAVAPQSRGNVTIRFGNSTASTSVTGTNKEYLFVTNTSIAKGAMFTDYDVQQSRKVCVLGQTVAQNLTGSSTTDLTGQYISINSQQFYVDGMLTPKGAGAFGQDQDDIILMPVTTAMQRLFNKDRLDFLSVRCISAKMMPLATVQIANFLRNAHHLRPPYPQNDDFQITNQTQIVQQQASVTSTMTSLLAAVAVISLVIGGIGIMNIMLVSVTERTREIGIRKAVGATPRDILMQFLIESSIMALIGGIIGIAFGVGCAMFMSAFAGWNTIVSLASVFIALFVSAGVGVFFGAYPASKAAALNPIDALRFE